MLVLLEGQEKVNVAIVKRCGKGEICLAQGIEGLIDPSTLTLCFIPTAMGNVERFHWER